MNTPSVTSASAEQSTHYGRTGTNATEWSVYEISKRGLDIALSLSAITFLSPLFLVIFVLVRFSGPGAVVFKQRRLGRDGREFWCYKFRTMVQNAEQTLQSNQELLAQFGENFKIKNDPRITPVGSVLRKTSLDELPQLFNVLNGTMSIIGPRPIVLAERSKYQSYAGKLLSVKPGMGGYWQVYGRSDTTYDQRIGMDMYYVDNRSLYLDIKLIALTAYVVIRRRGAY